MHTAAQGLNRFAQDWCDAFARVCEMVTSIRPNLTWDPNEPAHREPDPSETYFWWNHVIAAEETQSPVWIGTPQPAWSKIVEALEPADEQQGQDAYRDILAQALMAVAQDVAERKGIKLTIPSAVPDDPQPENLLFRTIRIELGDALLPDVLLGVDPDFAASLEPAAQPETTAAAPARTDPGLERLIDLELPVSVVLGRTTLPIREVLKITPGSLIELGHQLGDPVELVVEDAVVARGEVVAVRGNYGVRIHQLISRQDHARLQPPPVPAGQAGELRN